MRVRRIFCAPGASSMTRINRMSIRMPRKVSYESPHRFDTGFIPTADYADDHVIVTRNSPYLSRKQETARRVSDRVWFVHRRKRRKP